MSFTVDVLNVLEMPTGSATNPINGANPYTYAWSAGSANTTATEGGLVKEIINVTITDNNGCFIVESFSIDQPLTALSVTLNKTDVDCFGSSTGSITTVVNGGTSVPNYSFLWNNGSTAQNRSNLSAGLYTVTVTDGNNCQKLKVLQYSLIEILSEPTTTNVSCNGGNDSKFYVTASGGSGVLCKLQLV